MSSWADVGVLLVPPIMPGPREARSEGPCKSEFYVCSPWTTPCAITFLKGDSGCGLYTHTMPMYDLRPICLYHVIPSACNQQQGDVPCNGSQDNSRPPKTGPRYGMNGGYLGPFSRTFTYKKKYLILLHSHSKDESVLS